MEEQTGINNQLSKTSTNLDQESLLALVAVRPPTPDKCAVCLNNKQVDIIARIDSCSHTFCFSCILEWSKVRAICPLCKQPFNLITREHYSGDLIEEVRIQAPRRSSSATFTNINDVLNWVDRHHSRSNHSNNDRPQDVFRQMVYIEWLNTIQSIVRRPNNTSRNSFVSPFVRETHTTTSWSNIIPLDSIRRLLHRYLRQTTSDLRQSTIYSQSTRQTVAFRKYIYLNHLLVRSPLIGHNHDTLTVRECSPTWYASNPACLHRLVPFLARELLALLWNDETTIEHIIQEILTTIQLHNIRSSFLTRKLNEYLRRYTRHFIHEFYTFARCPYDLAGFDRHAQYPRMNTTPNIPLPMQISIDDDDDDDNNNNNDNNGNEQTPIILDETPDVSINITDIALSSSSSSSSSSASSASSLSSSSPSSSPSPIEIEHRSSSPECEIVEYVEPTRERTPTLIVLSEDEDENENESNNMNNEPQIQVASSKKRKHHHHRSNKRYKNQETTSGTYPFYMSDSLFNFDYPVQNLDSPTSVILDDDDDDELQINNSNQEQSQEENHQ
ncbi:unnamed protein product [Adineta steineri]|uniref:RING-type E3 ubiquitin transferase n=1 Tax=Adineta steineri TaxID=433720 RepID=A0A814A5M1_9BILA|nr:unnamed protein product [Adineta steineri]